MERKDKSGNSSWADEMNASSSESQDSDNGSALHTPDSASELRFERLAQSRKTNRIDTADAENSNSGLQEPLLSFTPITEEVQNVAHNLATSIFSDWSQLHSDGVERNSY
jgi:hypothetical protein